MGKDKKVVVLANLKERNICGVKSYGMLMATSDASHENVDLLAPTEGSLPGERVWFGSTDEVENLPDTASPNQAANYVQSLDKRKMEKAQVFTWLLDYDEEVYSKIGTRESSEEDMGVGAASPQDSASCVAALGGVHIMQTSAGVVVSPSLKDDNIS
ncbi:hypothetical protein LguiA_014313 [Lonicera macranthoides]